MNGLIALVGSGEYLPVMEDVDRYLLDSLNLNGRKPRVVCLPTAAGRKGTPASIAGRAWALTTLQSWARK